MCYSAQIKADYTRFVREYGAVHSIKDFFDLFWRRLSDPNIQVPRAVEIGVCLTRDRRGA
ncbi:hypothetical protein [Pseudorhodoferax sp. Leaf267]|uniref:hypothetical protein n=1 Tax=Pseudorhodoferax sp. Leaf267 TaxID=1736316 RepID=UPI0006F477D8|nr:hypothetical protein [Pseudorhodoferax sp. Leaf267]KQP23300.1 hypothetical protein ASF43_05385 [Pseudorhodoferax sp. Leaf267]